MLGKLDCWVHLGLVDCVWICHKVNNKYAMPTPMNIPRNLDMQLDNSDPGVIADAIINYLDANWSSYTCEQRDELISEAELFHAVAVKHLFS